MGDVEGFTDRFTRNDNDDLCVPLRLSADYYGIALEWDGATATVTAIYGDNSFSFTVAESQGVIQDDDRLYTPVDYLYYVFVTTLGVAN